MSSIVVSELAYSPPGHDSLFFDVSFGVSPGEHAALVGPNGVGKSTILRIRSGELEPDDGETAMKGNVLTMTQDVGMSRPSDTLRDMLIEVAPKELRLAGRRLAIAERDMLDGTDDGMAFAEALTEWGDLGTDKVVAVEGSGAWVHGGSYATFGEARHKRQEQLGDELKRWNDEERRLFQHMKIMKQRAAQNFKNAAKANAAETRWEKFVAAGPPPPPVPNQQIYVNLRGADAARRVAVLKGVGMGKLFRPFTDEFHHGERIGLIGPNGTGKSHLLGALSGEKTPDHCSIVFGPRTSVGVFTQINDRPDFLGRDCFDIVRDRVHDDEKSMTALARYGLRVQARQEFQTLSGGQKARLEILCLELEGHNVLLLDEPTDNLDVDSSEALEQALDGFEGTIIAVSHDRTFLAKFDRFLMITEDGDVYELPDYDVAIAGLSAPETLATLRLAKNLN